MDRRGTPYVVSYLPQPALILNNPEAKFPLSNTGRDLYSAAFQGSRNQFPKQGGKYVPNPDKAPRGFRRLDASHRAHLCLCGIATTLGHKWQSNGTPIFLWNPNLYSWTGGAPEPCKELVPEWANKDRIWENLGRFRHFGIKSMSAEIRQRRIDMTTLGR